jgi:branched-chain amino acid transport system substrate-binding protein
MIKRTALIALTIGAGLIAGCGGDDKSTSSADSGGDGGGAKTLKIGFSGALSGAYASVDEPLLNGMKFAADQINAGKGPKGVKVEVVVKDNRGEQTLTSTTTQEMLDDGIRTFVLTTADSSVAEGQLVTAGGGIAAMGTNTSPQLLSDIGDRAFMLIFGDNVQAAAAAEQACKQGYKTAYTFASPEIPYTRDLPVFFEQAFADSCGGKVIGKDTYKLGSTDYGSQVTKLQSAGSPDVVYTPMYVPDLGAFLKQLRSGGDDVPVISADGADTQLLVDSGGSAIDGLTFTTHAFPTPGSEMATFFDEFTKATGKKPESSTFEAIGRDTVFALAQAAADSDSTEPDPMLETILGFKDLDLVTGKLTMDRATRIPVKPVALITMKGSKFTYLDSIVPKAIPPIKGN